METSDGIAPELLNPVPFTIPERSYLDRKPDSEAFLIAIICTLFIALLTFLQWSVDGSFEALASSYNSVVVDHQYYRLVTSLFMHGDLKHILSNLFYGSVLIFFLVGYFGSMTILPAALLFGALTNYLTVFAMQGDQYLLGFSGVVFWLGSTWLTLYFLLMTRYSWGHRIVRTLGVALLIFFPSEAFDPTISYRAHLFGFIGGILFGLGLYFSHKKRWKAATLQPPQPVAQHQ